MKILRICLMPLVMWIKNRVNNNNKKIIKLGKKNRVKEKIIIIIIKIIWEMILKDFGVGLLLVINKIKKLNWWILNLRKWLLIENYQIVVKNKSNNIPS